jgi:CRP-like cAMP-binding protein
MHLNPFIDYLLKKAPLSAGEIELMKRLLSVKAYKKGTVLLAEGEVSQAFYFILEGCCRMYYLVDGREKNTHFYTEHQFVSSYESFVNQRPSNHFIDCLEACKLVIITAKQAAQMLSYSSGFEQLSRIFMEEELMLYQKMLFAYVGMNSEQRYQMLLEEYPDLIQRIPQYHLASYLGLAPETLSRVRQRISKNE